MSEADFVSTPVSEFEALHAEVKRLNQALDMLAEQREAWKAKAERLQAAERESIEDELRHNRDLSRLRAEIERLKAELIDERNNVVLYADDRNEWRAKAERLRAALDESEDENDQWQKKLTDDAWPEIERLRAALTEIMQGARSVDYAIHVARVALARPTE